MKTLSNYITTGITLMVLLISFQTNCVAQSEQPEWREVNNMFTAVQELTPYHIRISLFDEMADEADSIFQHETGMLMFVTTLQDEEEIDLKEELLYGFHAFNGNRLSPVREMYKLEAVSGLGMTYAGTIGGMPMLADQIFVTDDAGYMVRVLTIRADEIGQRLLPECVSEWIQVNFEKAVPVLAKCGGR